MDFNDLILKRRSVRSFIKKEIPDNIIFDAINDSVNCPSWKNSQVSRFYLISSIEAINKIQMLIIVQALVRKQALLNLSLEMALVYMI